MGAELFQTIGHGEIVDDAYQEVVARALQENGDQGYTGSIAEKEGFLEYQLPDSDNTDVMKVYKALVDSYDNIVPLAQLVGQPLAREMADVFDRKWGPAITLKIKEGEWLFCGWASC